MQHCPLSQKGIYKMTDITLNFGKHVGKKLSECPISYIWWLSEQESIKRQPEAPAAAQAYLASEEGKQKSKKERKYEAPRTKEEAEKFSWMIRKLDNDYLVRQAKLAMLENRDEEGFLVVFDGDDKHNYYEILYVCDDGTCDYAGFKSEEQLRRVLKRHNMEREYESYSHRIYEVDEEKEDYEYYEDIEDQDYW